MKTSRVMLAVVTFGLGALLAGCGAIGEVGGVGGDERARASGDIPARYKMIAEGFTLARGWWDTSDGSGLESADVYLVLGPQDGGTQCPNLGTQIMQGDFGAFRTVNAGVPRSADDQRRDWGNTLNRTMTLRELSGGVCVNVAADIRPLQRDRVIGSCTASFTNAQVTGGATVTKRCGDHLTLRFKFVPYEMDHIYYGCAAIPELVSAQSQVSDSPAADPHANCQRPDQCARDGAGGCAAQQFCREEQRMDSLGREVEHHGTCTPCSDAPASDRPSACNAAPAPATADAPCPMSCGPGTICNIQSHTCNDLSQNECDVLLGTGCSGGGACEERTTEHPTIPAGEPNHVVRWGVCVDAPEQPATGSDGPSCGGACPRGKYCSASGSCTTDYNNSHYECTALDAACTYAGAAGTCKGQTRTDSRWPAGDPNHTVELFKCDPTGAIADSNAGQDNFCAAEVLAGRRCGHLEGGCKSNNECESGLTCREDTRLLLQNYHPVRYCWDAAFCAKKSGGCDEGEGGCTLDSHCKGELVCLRFPNEGVARFCGRPAGSAAPAPKHEHNRTVAEGADCTSDSCGADGACATGQCCLPGGDATECECNGFWIGAGHTCLDPGNTGGEQPTSGGAQPAATGGADAPAPQSACLNGAAGSDRYTAGGILYECWKVEEGWAQVWRDGTWQKWNRTPVDGANCHGWLSNTKGNSLAWQYCRPGGATPASNGDFLPVEDASLDVAGGCAVAPGADTPAGLGLLLLGLLALQRRRR